MRVILDINVPRRALIDTIYHAGRLAQFEFVTLAMQLEELRRVSGYTKFKAILLPHRIGTMVNNMQCTIALDILPVLSESFVEDDPDGYFLLAMALIGEADYFVTGDQPRWSAATR